jgi:hypothetical protein
LIIGGAWNDVIKCDSTIRNILIGDEANVQLNLLASNRVAYGAITITSLPCTYIDAATTDTVNLNGNDVITSLIATYTSIIIGGGSMDTITTNGSLLTVLIGDYGDVTTMPPAVWDTTGVVTSIALVQSTFATMDMIGATDQLHAATSLGGRTVILGGGGSDTITLDTFGGDVTICGDHCQGKLQCSRSLARCNARKTPLIILLLCMNRFIC